MKKLWIGSLSALLALLWARLPGPAAQNEPDPQSIFRCTTPDGQIINVSAESANLSWLSQIGGISMEKIELRPDGWHSSGAFVQSQVAVEMPSQFNAELHALDPQVGQQLLSGEGYYAIKAGKAEFPVEGDGTGLWIILPK